MSGINLEESDGWARISAGYSKGPVESFIVTIENFEAEMEFAKYKSYIESPKFCIEDTILSLRTYPCGNNGSSCNISFSLVNHGNEEIQVSARFLAFGKIPEFRKYFIQPGMIMDSGCGEGNSPNFISHNESRTKLINGELHVKVEVSVIQPKEKKIVCGGKMVDESEEDIFELNEVSSLGLLENCFSMNVSPDFKLVSNGSEFPCHKIFIAGQSETLAGAVERWLPEGVMKLDEHKSEVVKNLVSYCYRQPIDEKVFMDNLAEFLEISEKFDLDELKLKAELGMISILGKDNFVEIMITGDLYGGEKVKKAGLRFLSQNKKVWLDNVAKWSKMLEDKSSLLMEIVTALAN